MTSSRQRILFWSILGFQTLVIVGMVAPRYLTKISGRVITLETEPVDPPSLFSGDYARFRFAIARVEAVEDPVKPYAKGDRLYVELSPVTTGWAVVSASRRKPKSTPIDHVLIRGVVEQRVDLRNLKPLVDLKDYSEPGWLAHQPSTASWRRHWTPAGWIDQPYATTELAPGTSVYIHLNSYNNSDWYLAYVNQIPAAFKGAGGPKEMILTGVIGSLKTSATLLMDYGIETYYIPEGEGRRFERSGIKVDVAISASGRAVIKKVHVPEFPAKNPIPVR